MLDWKFSSSRRLLHLLFKFSPVTMYITLYFCICAPKYCGSPEGRGRSDSLVEGDIGKNCKFCGVPIFPGIVS